MKPTLKNYLYQLQNNFFSEKQKNKTTSVYPAKERMIRFIEKNVSKAPVYHCPEDFSRYGKAITETRSAYLNNESVGASTLKEVLSLSQHFLNCESTNRKKHVDNASNQLSNLIHMAFIEPEKFSQLILVPDFRLTVKSDVIRMIKLYRELNGNESGKVDGRLTISELRKILNNEKKLYPYGIIKESHYNIVQQLTKNSAVYANRIIPKILKGAQSGLSFYYVDPATGIPVKTHPDFINTAENIGVDAIISLRTTHCDNFDQFYQAAAKYKYKLSEGMHQEVVSHVTGRNFNTTIMIMMQTIAPYQVAVFRWSPDDLDAGKEKYHALLQIMKDCTGKEATGIISMKLQA